VARIGSAARVRDDATLTSANAVWQAVLRAALGNFLLKIITLETIFIQWNDLRSKAGN
jgi:hypothetical protein